MSFTDDFLKGLEKRNVKQSWTKQNDYSQYDDYTRDFLTSLEKRKKKKEEEEETSLVEDIAPVRSDRGKADLFGLDLVQKGAFDDGYQFGDVSKAILGTAGDIGYGLFQGIGGLAEGLVDSAGYLAAGVADLLGYEDTARSMRQTSSKSQMDQLDQLLGADDFLEKYSVAGNTLDAVGQGVGQVGTLIATGGLASTGLGATALTTGLMGVSGVGSGISEAYEGGADDDEALTYGLISGAADAFTEMIFGGLGKGVNALGIGKGLSSADDMLAKAVSSKFKSTVAKNVAEFGIKAGAEGLEEVLAGTLQAAGKKATYMSEEDFGKLLDDENLFEQFIVGAMASGIAQAGSVKTSIKTGQDFITGLTQNEQTVVDSLYESEIADKDLDKKEKQKIYDQILTKLDKGYVSTDDIESILGGETYKAYKDTIDSEKALKDKLTASQKEYNELKGIHWKERSQEQNSRLAELETEIKTLDAQVKETTANSKLGEMKSQLSKSVFELTKSDTKLQESYREEMRRGQDLELDVEQYKGAAKITAQNLLKGGMNNTNRVHDVVNFLTKLSADKNIVFDVATAKKLAEAGLAVDGRTVNGAITKDGIVLNLESSAVLETTVGHEITHALEGTEHYEVLKSVIKEYAELKGVYADKYSSLESIYAKKDAKGNILKDANGNTVWIRDDVDIDSEIVADLVGEYLFTDADFINNLSVKHRNVFQKVYDEIKYLLKIATAGSEEARKLEEVKRAFDKAYKENKASVETDVKHSLSESKTLYTGSPVTDIQQFKVGGANGAKQTGDRYGRGIYLTTNKTTAKGYAGDSGRVYEINADDLNIFDLNDPITEEMKATLHRELNGKDKQFRNSVLRNFRTEKTFTDFESAEKFFDAQRKVWKEEDGYYSANKPEIKSADDKTGIAVIEYTDFVNIDNAIGSLTGNQLYDALKSISTDDFASFITGHGFDGIAFDEDADNQQYVIYRNEDRLNILPDSKVKYSLTDSEGRQLSKEQSEYFKDSKARDEDGNLRVVYHGTYEDFTVFDISKTKYANAFGQGHYFTSKKTDAQNNYASGNGADVRTKVEELAWIYFEEMGYTEADYESNDAVEEWNAAYDKAEAFYASGKVVQAYLNIKNPLYAGKFDELYDANGNTVSARSAELLKELGYDGIIDYYVSDRFGRFQNLDDDTAHYIVFDSNQIKLTTNTTPTSDPDIRFSLSEAVEETKDLVALHNLTESKLTKVMDLGGFPMPSIAITKTDIPHTNFGDITLVMDRSTIDPKANRKNTVYSADAWTPTVPRVSYKPSSSRLSEISKKVYGLLGDRKTANALDYIAFDEDNVSDALDRYDGDLVSKYLNNNTMKYAFLKDIGADIELPMTETKLHRGVSNEAVRYFSGKFIMGSKTVQHYRQIGATELMNDKEFTEAVAEVLNWDVLRQFEEGSENYEKLKENPLYKADDLSFSQIDGLLSAVQKYFNHGIEQEVDRREASNTISRYFDDNNLQEQYESWLGELFSGVVEKTGIYNNKDIFTPSGNRRTFEQLHLPVTLENIVKAMVSQNGGNTKNVAGFNGVKTLRAGMAERFKSIDDMHKLEGRLQHLTDEEFEAIHDQLSERMNDVINRILATAPETGGNIYMRMDSVGETLMEIAESGKYTTKAIQNTVNKYIYNIGESLAEEIRTLLYDVSQMPTNMFEAKPERAVGFDEVRAAVLPDNVSNTMRERLENMGVNVLTYEAGNNTDRLNKLNGLFDEQPDLKFSLSDPNDIAPVDFRKSAKYLMVDKSNAQNFGDIAPTQKRTDAPVATDDEEIKAETLVDRDSFVVRRAKELYEEITNLKKGVRASKSLGYLLDHGHEWRSIKTALLNIRDNPNQVVNENSAAESVAREMLGREYDEMVYELNEQTDVAGSIRTKMKSIQTEIDNNEKLREQANADYDAEIAEVQAKYDAKKNKNTIEANNLLRRIERLHRLKNTNDANYAKRISDLEARLERMSQPTYKTAVQRRKKQSEYTELMESLVGDTSTWVDKKLGISYKINTLRRNLRDIVRDASGKQDIAKADAIYDELQGNYNRHEAALKRESKRLTQVFADMKLTSAEDTYAHMLGEFRHNPDSKLTEETVKEYYEQHKKDIDTAKVDKAIEEARKTFDELIARVNDRLREQGMKEIPYRQGYFPHFTNPKQGFLAKLFNWKPVDHEIPTSIAGITETFNPERSWQSFNKERKSDITDYSLAQGLDTYIHGSLDWIYHIEDIQKRRAFENYIRYIHSEEGVKARIDAIRNSEELDADEMQDQIDLVYAEANNPLNNFVTDLRAGTNTLAAKKSSMDRALEEKTNRKIYSVMTNLNNRVNANMVVGSISSALTNFIPIVQSWVEVSPMYSLRGMGDTIRSTARDDGIINKSTFLTNRLIEEEKLYKTGWDKASEKAAFLMQAVDSFTSQTVWRSKYLQNISEGMSENEAIHNADQFAENVIAGRSRGNMPTIFDAKNPLTKMFTAFQLEVNNQYGYMFKDAPTDSKNKARLVKGFATMLVGSYLYNALYSSLVGRDAAFDPLSIIEDLLGDLEDEEEEEAIVNLANNVIEEIPFVGSLFGGGRIPLSSALPYSGEYEGLSKLVTDISEENWENVGREMLQPLYYLVLPFGGGQVKKTNEGLGVFSEDHPIAGSYTASGNLRFPVEDNFINRMQAALFGQYASQNARDYFDNNRTALKEKQIQEFIDVDIPIRDYWEYREGLSEQKTIEDKFDYIAGLDLPVSKKNILINNIVDREESVDLEGYEDFSTYEEFDFATKNPEKYTVAKAVGGFNSYTTHYKAMNDISADKDENGKSIVGSRKEKIIDYVNSLDIDYGMKIILFKSEYKADDTYNADILEYLNSRDDLTYEEIVTILTELDFTVDGNGNVYWD